MLFQVRISLILVALGAGLFALGRYSGPRYELYFPPVAQADKHLMVYRLDRFTGRVDRHWIISVPVDLSRPDGITVSAQGWEVLEGSLDDSFSKAMDAAGKVAK
jgi:hypothetical protein